MLYIFNANEELLTILNNNSDSPAFWGDMHHEKLSGENTFSFTVPADNDDAQYITEGNLVAWKDLDGYWQMFEIVRKVDTHGDGLIRDVDCEHVAYEMLDDFLTSYTSGSTTNVIVNEDGTTTTVITPTEIDANSALTSLLAATRWTPGTITVTGSHSFAYAFDNPLALLQKIAAQWEGELQYRLTITNGVITGRFVDLLSQRGQDRGKQFVYGKDMQDIERDIDISSVCTALYGRGKDDLTVLVTDLTALALWGRANGTRHRYGLYENADQEDEVLLYQETLTDLQKRNTPIATYTLKVVALESIPGYEDEKTRIGDTVRGIDRKFNPPLLVELRVVEITRSLSNPEDTEVVLGAYKASIVDDLVEQRIQNSAEIPDLTPIQDDIIAIQDDVTAIQDDIVPIKDDIIAIQDDIIPIKEDIGLIQGDIVPIKDDISLIKEDVVGLKETATDIENGDLRAEIIKIGIANGSGICQIDTRGDGIRIQSHASGNYLKVGDNGGLTLYVGGVDVAHIYPDGTTDLVGPGGGGSQATATDIVYSLADAGVVITKDGNAETWTWIKDGSGRIISMTSSLGRTISVTY